MCQITVGDATALRLLDRGLTGKLRSGNVENLMQGCAGHSRQWAGNTLFDITSRVMSDNVLRLSTTASCGSILIPNLSRNVTTFSTAMESRIPVVMSGVLLAQPSRIFPRQELIKDIGF